MSSVPAAAADDCFHCGLPVPPGSTFAFELEFALSGLPTVATTLAWFWCAAFLGLALSALWRWHDDHHHHHHW